MLTQTKPVDTTPLVYRTWTPSQKTVMGSQATAPPTTGRRVPLGELSFSDPDLGSPSETSPLLTRLRKVKERESSPSSGRSPGAKSADAFTLMMQAQKMKEKRERKKLRSDFVEGEAMESDEDEMFGFGPKTKELDEDSDDDPDEIVENLVDDGALTEEQLAKERVLEKVQYVFPYIYI